MFGRRAVLVLFVLAVAIVNLGVSSQGCIQEEVDNAGRSIPRLSYVEATGDLVQGRLGVVRLYCTVTEEDAVTAVSADLQALGKEEVELFPGSNGVSYLLQVSVRPPTAGTMTIPFLLINAQGEESTVTTTVEILPDVVANQAPQVSGAKVIGNLTQGQAGQVTIQCTALDPDGVVASVTADLSAIGGGAAQALQGSGNAWSRLCTVTPLVAGKRTVSLTGTDNRGATCTAEVDILVAPLPNQAPQVSGAKVIGNLTQGQAGQVTIQCTAMDPDGVVASVTADLSAIGGSAAEALQGSGNAWSRSCTVTPPVAGVRTVSLKGTDNSGATCTAEVDISVATASLPSLAGAWQSQGDPLQDGTTVTLIIGSDGSAIAQVLALPPDGWGTYSIQLICDGQPRPVYIGYDEYGIPMSLSVSRHGYGVDASHRIHFDTFTISSSEYGDVLTVSGDGQLTSDNSMTLNWTTDVYGTVAVDFVKLDPMPDLEPYFNSATATGTLLAGEPGTVDLACNVADLSGTVVSVEANLIWLDRSDTVPLVKGSNGLWTATGVEVTPLMSGEAMAIFTATSDTGLQGMSAAIITVGTGVVKSLEGAWDNDDGEETIIIDDAGNAVSYFFEYEGVLYEIPCDGNPHDTPFGPVAITPHTITVDETGVITVSQYTMTDPQGQKTITASGTVDSPIWLTLYVTVGEGPFSYDYTAYYTKADFPPNERPRITGLQLNGSLTYLVPSTVTFTCQVVSAGDPLTSVTIDLWDLGIEEPQPMSPSGDGSWIWTGEVTPQYDDYVEVWVDAEDEKGAWDDYEADFTVNP